MSKSSFSFWRAALTCGKVLVTIFSFDEATWARDGAASFLLKAGVKFPCLPQLARLISSSLALDCTSWVWGLGEGSSVVFVMSWSQVSLFAPVFNVNLIFSGLGLSSSWWLRFLFHVDVRFSLEKVAVLESAFDEMEEVSNKFSLGSLINTFEKFWVHLCLEIFIHIDFKVALKKGLFSQLHFVHIGVHAHGFNFSHLLLLNR